MAASSERSRFLKLKRWLTFLRNHREAIAAMDFFTVPTLTFGVLYCFFVIGHDRRKILHFKVTEIPVHFGLYSNCEKHGVMAREQGNRTCLVENAPKAAFRLDFGSHRFP
jgi:hypothetical protein